MVNIRYIAKILFLCIIATICTARAEENLGFYSKSAKENNYQRVIKPRILGHDSRFKSFPYIENGIPCSLVVGGGHQSKVCYCAKLCLRLSVKTKFILKCFETKSRKESLPKIL